MKTKLLVVGPILTRSGYGEQSRYALRALRSQEDAFDIYVQPLKWGQTGWVPEYDEEKMWIDHLIEKTIAHSQQNGAYDASLQITIPNEWKSYAPINIGYTAGMETTLISGEWIAAINAMNKVIVISNHSKNVMEFTKYVQQGGDHTVPEGWLKTETDIEVVNYPAKVYESLPEINLELEYDTNF